MSFSLFFVFCSPCAVCQDPVKSEWRLAHLHACLCSATGSFNDGSVKSSSSSGSSGPRVIRISGDGSGGITSSSSGGGGGAAAAAAEDLGLQIGELIAKEIAGNQAGDSTEKIIEQVGRGIAEARGFS
jgi:hypothetical protein